MARLRAIAFADLGDFAEVFNFSPQDILREARERGLSYLIKGVKIGKYGPEITFHDAVRALDILARHLLPTKNPRVPTAPETVDRPMADFSDEELMLLG